MKDAFKEIPFWDRSYLKVLENAEEIMKGENIEGEEKEITVVAIYYMILVQLRPKKTGSIGWRISRKRRPSK